MTILQTIAMEREQDFTQLAKVFSKNLWRKKYLNKDSIGYKKKETSVAKLTWQNQIMQGSPSLSKDLLMIMAKKQLLRMYLQVNSNALMMLWPILHKLQVTSSSTYSIYLL